MYVLSICKYIRVPSKTFSASKLKYNKAFLIKELRCHVASYTIHFFTTRNPVNFYLTSTVDKTHHKPVIVPFFCANFKMSFAFFLDTPEFS